MGEHFEGRKKEEEKLAYGGDNRSVYTHYVFVFGICIICFYSRLNVPYTISKIIIPFVVTNMSDSR